MSETASIGFPIKPVLPARTTTNSSWIGRLLLCTALLFLTFFLLIPLAAVFSQALGKGIEVYFSFLREPDAVAAIELTLLVAAIVIPLNVEGAQEARER